MGVCMHHGASKGLGLGKPVSIVGKRDIYTLESAKDLMFFNPKRGTQFPSVVFEHTGSVPFC